MGDPQNPYRPYTYQAADHDRAYDAARDAKRRADADFVELMTRPSPTHTPQTGSSWSRTGARSGSGQDAGTFWLAAGVLIGFLWLGDRVGGYWTAGFMIGALLLAVVAVVALVRAFFRTRVGQIVATGLAILTVGAAVAAAGWMIHEMFGTNGLYWAGLLVAAFLAFRLTLYLLAAFLRTAAGKVTLWIGIAIGAAYIFLL